MKKRPGSLIVTSFVIVVGMVVVVGGINTMLKQQMDTAQDIQKISFAKLQTTYVAEMALNQMMFDANDDDNVDSATNPFTPVPTTLNSQVEFDFTNYVAMTRNVTSSDGTAATAKVVITRGATTATTAAFTAVATVYNKDVGTFSKTINFAATKTGVSPAAGWYLSNYTVAP